MLEIKKFHKSMNNTKRNQIIKRLRQSLDSNQINPTIIQNLFELFEDNSLLTDIFFKKGNYEFFIYEFNNYSIKYDIFLPLMKKILRNNSDIKDLFFKEVNRRLTLIEDFENYIDTQGNIIRSFLSEIKMAELFLNNCNKKKLHSFVKNNEENYFNLIYNIYKKLYYVSENKKLKQKKFDKLFYGSYFWQWGDTLYELFDETFSPYIRKAISKTIEQDNFFEFLIFYYHKLFDLMNKEDIIQLFSDQKLKIIEYVVSKLTKFSENKIDENEYLCTLVECNLGFSKKIIDYASDHIKTQIETIIKMKDEKEINILIDLNLLRFLGENLKKTVFIDVETSKKEEIIKKLQGDLDSNLISSATIQNLFQLFEDNTLLTQILFKTIDDEFYIYEFYDYRLKYNVFLPLMKKILQDESGMRSLFFKEIHSRLLVREDFVKYDDSNAKLSKDFCLEIKLIELFFNNISKKKFKSLIKGNEMKYYSLLYEIFKKLNYFSKINIKKFMEKKNHIDIYNAFYWGNYFRHTLYILSNGLLQFIEKLLALFETKELVVYAADDNNLSLKKNIKSLEEAVKLNLFKKQSIEE